jgi:hypothetical protein
MGVPCSVTFVNIRPPILSFASSTLKGILAFLSLKAVSKPDNPAPTIIIIDYSFLKYIEKKPKAKRKVFPITVWPATYKTTAFKNGKFVIHFFS